MIQAVESLSKRLRHLMGIRLQETEETAPVAPHSGSPGKSGGMNGRAGPMDAIIEQHSKDLEQMRRTLQLKIAASEDGRRKGSDK